MHACAAAFWDSHNAVLASSRRLRHLWLKRCHQRCCSGHHSQARVPIIFTQKGRNGRRRLEDCWKES